MAYHNLFIETGEGMIYLDDTKLSERGENVIARSRQCILNFFSSSGSIMLQSVEIGNTHIESSGGAVTLEEVTILDHSVVNVPMGGVVKSRSPH